MQIVHDRIRMPMEPCGLRSDGHNCSCLRTILVATLHRSLNARSH